MSCVFRWEPSRTEPSQRWHWLTNTVLPSPLHTPNVIWSFILWRQKGRRGVLLGGVMRTLPPAEYQIEWGERKKLVLVIMAHRWLVGHCHPRIWCSRTRVQFISILLMFNLTSAIRALTHTHVCRRKQIVKKMYAFAIVGSWALKMINLIGFFYRQNYRITHQRQIPCFSAWLLVCGFFGQNILKSVYFCLTFFISNEAKQKLEIKWCVNNFISNERCQRRSVWAVSGQQCKQSRSVSLLCYIRIYIRHRWDSVKIVIIDWMSFYLKGEMVRNLAHAGIIC